MNPLAVPTTSKFEIHEIIIPSFSSCKVETYFFREVIQHLDLENIPNNATVQFNIMKDPNALAEQLILIHKLIKGNTISSYKIREGGVGSSVAPIFLQVADYNTVGKKLARYEFTLNERIIPYLRALKAIDYCSVDWQFMESLRQKYSKKVYKFLRIAQLSGVREFSLHRNNVRYFFDISDSVYRKWRRHQHNFLADLHQEITQYSTQPLFSITQPINLSMKTWKKIENPIACIFG